MKVLIVGNSSIDKSKEVGSMIDQEFDIVIRMNRYRIEGYVEYLGTKTNTWVLNRAISLGKSRMPLLDRMRADGTWYGHHDQVISDKFDMNKKISEDLEEILLITYVSKHEEIVNLHNKVQKHKNFNVGDTWEVSKYLRSRWDELMSESFYKPATGLLTIHYFLEKYGKVYLHNFDNGRTRHYWGDSDMASEPMASKHNWSFDEILIGELVESGKVSYL
jgi:hypothetical protein